MDLNKAKSKGKDIVAGLTLIGVFALCTTLFFYKPNLSQLGSEENPIDFNTEKAYTKTVVDVIDVKCLPDSSGMPHWFLVMQNKDPNKGHVFCVESTITDYYDLLGRTLTITKEQHPFNLKPPTAFALSEWDIDSIHK